MFGCGMLEGAQALWMLSWQALRGNFQDEHLVLYEQWFLLNNCCQIRELLGSRSVFCASTGHIGFVTAASVYNIMFMINAFIWSLFKLAWLDKLDSYLTYQFGNKTRKGSFLLSFPTAGLILILHPLLCPFQVNKETANSNLIFKGSGQALIRGGGGRGISGTATVIPFFWALSILSSIPFPLFSSPSPLLPASCFWIYVIIISLLSSSDASFSGTRWILFSGLCRPSDSEIKMIKMFWLLTWVWLGSRSLSGQIPKAHSF